MHEWRLCARRLPPPRPLSGRGDGHTLRDSADGTEAGRRWAQSQGARCHLRTDAAPESEMLSHVTQGCAGKSHATKRPSDPGATGDGP